ncbi:MAG TPA: tetratricopeptide repeat protein [archaeon]|nr:tetratricopeptide repeat protein [archaeon]
MVSSLRLKLLIIFLILSASCMRVSTNYEERGDYYYRYGYYDDSLAEYLMAQKTQGVTTSLLRKIGKVYVMKGDFFQAKNYYDRYFNASDKAPDAEVLLDYLQIAVERGKAGDNTTMVHALEEILHIDPSYSLGRYFFDLGEFYFQQADYRKAITYFLRGLPLQLEVENRADYLFHLAQSYEKLEDYFDAFLYFDQFIVLYPDHPQIEQVRWHRGSCCYPLAQKMFSDGDIEGALFYLDEIISKGQPQHLLDDAYFLRGEFLLASDRPEEAEDAYRQVMKLNRYYWKEKIVEQARRRIQELELNKRVK